MRIKVVSNDAPNEDGRWLDVPGNPPQFRSWVQTAEALERHVPPGHHLVMVTTDDGARSMWKENSL